MPYDMASPLLYLKATLAAVAGVQNTYTGVPESIGNRVVGWVAIGPQSLSWKAAGIRQRVTDYVVEFAYRVTNDEGTAETTLASFLDAFTVAVEADLTLGGTVETAELNLATLNRPEYRVFAGQEFRTFPIVVSATQRRNRTA